MFRYTNPYHCVTVAYSIQYPNMPYRSVAQNNRLHHIALGYSRLYHSRFVGTLSDVHIKMEMPKMQKCIS